MFSKYYFFNGEDQELVLQTPAALHTPRLGEIDPPPMPNTIQCMALAHSMHLSGGSAYLPAVSSFALGKSGVYGRQNACFKGCRRGR